jgi:hypothetical protein
VSLPFYPVKNGRALLVYLEYFTKISGFSRPFRNLLIFDILTCNLPEKQELNAFSSLYREGTRIWAPITEIPEELLNELTKELF